MCVGAAKYLSYALPHLLEGCKDKDANVRQCSVYGLGIMAAMHQEAFRPNVPNALMHILGIITAPDARCPLPRNIQAQTVVSRGAWCATLFPSLKACCQCNPTDQTPTCPGAVKWTPSICS